MTAQTTEIARQEGREFRAVRLHATADGAISMATQDIGAAAAELFGDNEYEFWVRVAPDALQGLVFELLKDRFAGRLDATDALRDYCKSRGIAHEFGNWM